MKKELTIPFLLGCGLFIFPPIYASILQDGIENTTISVTQSVEKIKGKVTDKDGKPLSQAIIAETVNQYSNNIVQCDSTGHFEITVNDQSTALVISAIGYLPKELAPSEFKGKENLSIALELNPDFTIEEIEVSAKRQTIVTTPTGLVYSMNDSPLKNSDALEAFKFVPMMMVKDELPSIVGRGVPVVYVNNRKLNFSGQSLTAYLRSLPAQNIETVEIIRNPGARYEGAESVLLIKLKKREDEGVKGFLNGKVWKIHDVEENLSVSLDYTKNKWNSFLNVFLGDARGYYDSRNETQYLTEEYTVNRTELDKSKGKYGNVNFMGVYQFSDVHSLGFNANASLNDNDGSRDGMTIYNHTNQRISSLSDREGTVWGATANLNYQYHSKDGKKYFIADVDYLYNDYKQYVINEMNNVDEQGNIQSLYLKERQNVPQRSDIYSAKLEYGGKSENNFDYDFGADAYYSHIRTDNQYWDWAENDFAFDNENSSDFKIKEFTPALFFDLSKWWSEKFYTSLAARFEYTKYEGKEYRQGGAFDNDFFRVLPKLNMYYSLGQNRGLTYTLSYRLSRPSFYDLNPFVRRISPTEYSVGNPYLQPVKIFFTELNYTMSNNLAFYLQYQLMDDMQNIVQKNVGDGVIESKPENVGQRDYIGFGIIGYLPYLNKRGVLNMNANYAWLKMDGETAEVGGLNYTRHLASATISNSFLLFPKQNIRFNLIGDFHSKEKNGYTTRPASIAGNVELSTSIKDFSIAIYSQLTGSFYDGKITGIAKSTMENSLLVDNYFLKGQNFQIGLRFSYNFGNKKVKKVRQRNTSNSEIRERVNVNPN